MLLEDVRKTIEATIDTLTPARARRLAKDYLEPGAAKEQISKTAAELLDWSQRNRERLREFVAHEVSRQMKTVGVATQSEVDALRKRVRELERGTGTGASSRKKTTRKAGARKAASRTSAARTGSAGKPARTATQAPG
jgi:polyhydroxyalkanoate synthesis regulator phasin